MNFSNIYFKFKFKLKKIKILFNQFSQKKESKKLENIKI